MKNNKVVVFDLDDTLYYEVDFLKSAYLEIALKISLEKNIDKQIIYASMLLMFKKKENVFNGVIEKYKTVLSIQELLHIYRNHNPKICLTEDRIALIKELYKSNFAIGVITDGRSIQQRNKLKALGVLSFIDEIVISEEFGSEKPDVRNYQHFENKYGESNYYYIGDNTSKDFVSANALGWTTIKLINKGFNIHNIDESIFDSKYLAKYSISNFTELFPIIDK